MCKKIGRTAAACVIVGMTGVGFVLRRLQLSGGFDANGLPLPGSGILLGVYSAIVAALAVWYCLHLAERPAYTEAFRFAMPTAAVSVAGAGLIFAGCVTAFLAGGYGMTLEKIAALLGALAAVCLVASQASQRREAAPSPLVGMLPVVFYIVRLVGDFKNWSTDPIILDYWVKLFAMLAILLAAYYLAGFCFDRGKRRASALFCLLAVYFSGLCLADGGVDISLIVGGSMLWQGASAWQLLRPDGDPAEASAPET
ncbi:MAG: hypothetical protein Q3977_03895 [Oscillospiraceae bacterium]|nr:hypothetical protein [Oscillospiraceae bacterium]